MSSKHIKILNEPFKDDDKINIKNYPIRKELFFFQKIAHRSLII